MGIHICVKDREGRDHPGWDWIRHAGDRDFPDVVSDLPVVHYCAGDAGEYLDDQAFRPADFPAWRAAISAREWPNPGRFEALMDLLERNPDLWLDLSF